MKAEAVDVLVALGLAMRRRGDEGRAWAYLRAANAVARRPDFDRLAAEGRLREIPGIGPSIERTLQRFLATGEAPEWLAAEPPGPPALAAPDGFRDAPFADAPDLHCHTHWSDGTMPLDEVAAYAAQLGARAVGISDHSGSLRVARGLGPEEVRAQWADIARVQAAHPGLRILRGTECDILRDGTLDHPPEILAGFDYVIGSLHSHLRLPEAEQTERLLRALEQPHLTIVGHPTTRVPGRRPPANLDLPRVFAAAAARGVALEVNGNPGRLDLDAALAAQALAAGARLALGSDAHHPAEMPGILAARRIAAEAGATPDRIANFHVLARAPARR